jgi:hypothetical protein
MNTVEIEKGIDFYSDFRNQSVCWPLGRRWLETGPALALLELAQMRVSRRCAFQSVGISGVCAKTCARITNPSSAAREPNQLAWLYSTFWESTTGKGTASSRADRDVLVIGL